MPLPVLGLYPCGHDGTMHEEMNKRNSQPRTPGQNPEAVIYALEESPSRLVSSNSSLSTLVYLCT